jgi:hypothetical protein
MHKFEGAAHHRQHLFIYFINHQNFLLLRSICQVKWLGILKVTKEFQVKKTSAKHVFKINSQNTSRFLVLFLALSFKAFLPNLWEMKNFSHSRYKIREIFVELEKFLVLLRIFILVKSRWKISGRFFFCHKWLYTPPFLEYFTWKKKN